MEDGGVDKTVIDCGQNQLGQMADIPPLITFFNSCCNQFWAVFTYN